MRRTIQALLALAAGRVGAETVFKERTGGYCTDESGWAWVGSEAECEEGARALGWGDTTATDDNQASGEEYDPPGCYFEGNSLKMNPSQKNTGACTTSDICMCTLTAPACTNTDGSAPNSAAPCICGNAACTGAETTGMHCYLSQNRCRKGPVCAITDGSVPNVGPPCACGATDCDAESNGLICTAATDTCSSPQDCGSDASAYISNCTNFNDRCVCVQCDAGLYSSDCSKACPAPAIAVATDTLLAAGGRGESIRKWSKRQNP